MKENDRSYLLKEHVETLLFHTPTKEKYEFVKNLFIYSCFTGLAYIDIQKSKEDQYPSFLSSP